MQPRKVVSLGGNFYYVVGFVSIVKGDWLNADPENDERRPLSDPRIMGGLVHDATNAEVMRYVQVMTSGNK